MVEDIILLSNKTFQWCMQSLSLKPEGCNVFGKHEVKQNAQVGRAVVFSRRLQEDCGSDAERREMGCDMTHLQNHKSSA